MHHILQAKYVHKLGPMDGTSEGKCLAFLHKLHEAIHRRNRRKCIANTGRILGVMYS